MLSKAAAALAALLFLASATIVSGGRFGRSIKTMGIGMTTTPITLVPRPVLATVDDAVWGRPHHRHLQAKAGGGAYDMGGPDPICWKKYPTLAEERMAGCPNVTLKFLTQPPNPMYAMQDYPTEYYFAINDPAYDIVQHAPNNATPEVKWHIPHANIHSCVSSVGFCTPFVGNNSKLSTHTPALLDNLKINPQTNKEEVTFRSNIRLQPESYTIIAHIRWYIDEPNENGGPPTRAQIDMATAIVRSVLPPVHILTVSTPVQYAMAALVALICLFLAINLAFLVYYRNHKIMRFSQVNILMGMTLSGMLAVASVPAHADTSQLACSLRPWITIIPLNFMFGLLFGKTWRIFRLMNNKHLKALKIKESWVVFVAFLLTVPELLIHGIYFIIAPPETELEQILNDYTFIYECCGGDLIMGIFDTLHLIYAAIILILGCYVANKSASLATLFNEGKYIMFGIYTCSILAVILVPASFAVSSNPTTGYILRAMGICMAVAGTIGAINLPKIRLILSGVEISLDDNKTTNSRTSGTSATLAYASSSKTGANAAGAPGGGGGGASTIIVKNHVPAAVMEKLQDALAAGTRVSDRQKQGFAIVRHDFEQCVEQVRLLNELLSRCAFAAGGGSAASSGPPPGAHASAKVAPAST